MKYITTILILFVCFSGYGQVKIGIISIDSETANKYFADCYNHPDTITIKGLSEFSSCNGCVVRTEDYENFKRYMNQYNEDLKRSSIGEAYNTTKYPAGTDTLYEWYSGDKHSKEYKLYKHGAGQYTTFIGYLVPRKPSEIDFIKWINKTKQNQK